MKLVVEVEGARDLPARRGRGGVAPFVQVTFAGQRHATAVRPAGDASPTWNEMLVFVLDARGGRGGGLSDGAIDVGVYHRRASGGKSCLGRVRLFGAAVAPSAEEAVLLRCPLDKPSFFAPARGEVALRLYLTPYASSSTTAAAAAATAEAAAGNAYSSTYATTTFNDTTSMDGPETVVGGASTHSAPAMVKTTKKKKEPVQAFHSIPAQSSTGSLIFPPPPPPPRPTPPPAGVPKGPKKTTTPATADDVKAAEYLMVDKLEFLYVHIVRASNLPGMDLTLSIDPYVEVRVGNYSAVTGHKVNNHHPEWNQVFAFSKDCLQSDTIEVIVKHRNLLVYDSFVGRVVLPIMEVSSLAPPNRPLAPQWYGLKDAKDQWAGGEVMLAAWKGSQSDVAFAGALHAGAHDDLPPSAVAATHTKSYYSPRLCYLRCHVIAAQDLVVAHPADRRLPVNAFARVQLGAQRWDTRASPTARWDQDFFLVAAWPFEEPLVVTVMDAAAPGRHEVLGQLVLNKGSIKVQQFDKKKFNPPPPSWFDLERPRSGGGGVEVDGDGEEAGRRRGLAGYEFRSKIQLRVYYDAAYHVLDELTTYASDFEPSARPLRKPAPIGVLQLAVLRATGLPATNKPRPNAYCVAKYGQKWVRTRTLLDTSSPSWQEQFTFDVFDPCTVLTVAVLDNRQLLAGNAAAGDSPLGKIRIRVSTLASGRTYEQAHPLFVLAPPGRLVRCGDLHLAVRFRHTASWVAMMSLYLRPMLPNQHFAKPIPTHLIPGLRRAAVDIVAARLARAEPPLRPEAVHYLLRDPSAHPSPAVPELPAYSRRRAHAACARLGDVLAPAHELAAWLQSVPDWKHPPTTVLVLILFLTLTWMPELILPAFFLYLVAVGLWNFFRRRPAGPAPMEHYADGVDPGLLGEEFDVVGPASVGTPPDVVEWRYRRLLQAATSVQVFIGDVALQGERVHALLSWRDRRATAVALVAAAALAAVTYAVPFRALVAAAGLYVTRHPWLKRTGRPSALLCFFRRLPSNAEVML